LPPLAITDADRDVLERWLRRSKTSQALAMRARIVLAASEGKSNSAVSRELTVHVSTVRKWRGRYLELGPDGLLDEPRPGVPRTITDEQVEAVIVRTLETMPAVGTH
jgi:transposase